MPTSEKDIVSLMIKLYCKKKHDTQQMCAECSALLAYAKLRIEHCPKKQTKTFCSSCSTPCYKPDKREQIRGVMRFAGPRMLLHHPIVAIKHAVQSGRKDTV